MTRGVCLALVLLAAGWPEAARAEGWRGRGTGHAGESRVWRGHEGWRGGPVHSGRGHEGWRDGHVRAWRDAGHGGPWAGRTWTGSPWVGSPWVGVHANPWPVRPWGPVFVERAEPVWVEGPEAHLRPQTICVKPQPGYDYTGWDPAPPHRFLPADYRCITTQ
jgi:hypothetical protein